MASLTNLRMSACLVTFGGVSLGHTKGGVQFKYTPKYQPLLTDQYGDTPVDRVLVGEDVTIKVSLAEPQVAQLNIAIPAGADAINASTERLAIGTDAGFSSRVDAKQLILHPIDRAASDLSEDITIYLAVANDPVQLDYVVDKQRIYDVTFTALVSESYGNGRRLGHIGPLNIS